MTPEERLEPYRDRIRRDGINPFTSAPLAGCALALARGMERVIDQLDQLRECKVLFDFEFHTH